ncbi:hypothetical protein BS47DRAFT_1442897 [Hydnum rufescens UP504]|uniref:Uncharacterized protein n=1 Tax=Hydnum rufescens UP504 TaxID=1448309 RepID=A0A9P6DMG3_9AGAM|nr:hypothetical protein BS47DRAFT_1442897 [Hydnum rufescens UP504]
MVETIAEEVPEPHSSLYFSGSSLSGITSTVPSAHFEFSQAHEPQVHIADWEEDAGGEVMRRYYALWKEALDMIQQSKQGWIPTSSFKPPQDPVAIQAFYDYSDLSPVPLWESDAKETHPDPVAPPFRDHGTSIRLSEATANPKTLTVASNNSAESQRQGFWFLCGWTWILLWLSLLFLQWNLSGMDVLDSKIVCTLDFALSVYTLPYSPQSLRIYHKPRLSAKFTASHCSLFLMMVELSNLFVCMGVPLMDSGFRPNHWINHKEKLFSKGLVFSTSYTTLSFGFNSHSRKPIQLSALVLEVSSDSVKHVKTSFIGVHPYSTILKGKPDIPIVVSECVPNSEKQLRLWGFERLKDNQIKWFLTMTRRGNSTKSLAAITRDPEDRECLRQDIVWLHSGVYQRPSPLASDPAAFSKWSLWTTGKELPCVRPIETLNSKRKAIESAEGDSTAKRVWKEGNRLPPINAIEVSEVSEEAPGPMVLVWSDGGGDANMKGTIDGVCTHHLP